MYNVPAITMCVALNASRPGRRVKAKAPPTVMAYPPAQAFSRGLPVVSCGQLGGSVSRGLNYRAQAMPPGLCSLPMGPMRAVKRAPDVKAIQLERACMS